MFSLLQKKYETRIDIFAGSLIEFIKYKDKLIKTKKNSYQFHFILTGNGLYLKEVPDFYCNEITKIDLEQNKKILESFKRNC